MNTEYHPIQCTINGKTISMQVKRGWTLLYFLRDILNLTGTKYGCGTGDCGACKVLINGEPRNSCTIPAKQADGWDIVTIEGLQQSDGSLGVVQQAFVDAGAIQCGFCTPGMVITAAALLRKLPAPLEQDIRAAFSNNLCRCTGYVKIIEAVELAALRIQESTHVR